MQYYQKLLDEDNMSSWEKETASQKRGILEYLMDGSKHTVTEMMDNVPALKDASNQRAASLVRQLADAGILTRQEIARKAYLSINTFAL